MVLAAAVFFLADDPEAVKAEEKPGLSGYLTLLKDRRFWPLIPMMVISYAPVVGIRGLWAGPYLHDVYLPRRRRHWRRDALDGVRHDCGQFPLRPGGPVASAARNG